MHYILSCVILFYDGLLAAATQDFNYQFNTTVFEPEKTVNCTQRSEDFTNATDINTCHAISSWRRNHSKEYCADYWFDNARRLDEEAREAAQRASVQYCNGTTDFIPCVKCFNSATEPFWNEPFCVGYERWKRVAECFINHTNTAFKWPREVIINATAVTKTISLEFPLYNKCRNYFEDELFFENDINVTFPIFFIDYSEEDDKDFNVMLSFYLNAFEDNNPNGTTVNETKHQYGFRCQDFIYEGYLQTYHNRMYSLTNTMPQTVIENYQKMRSDMCMNNTGCINCFNKSDMEFFKRLEKKNYRIASLIAEFNQTSMMYNNCINNYNISQEYTAILNESHTGLEKVNVSNCKEEIKQTVAFLKNNPSYLNTNSKTKYKHIIDVTAFNVYSNFGYAAEQDAEESCEVIEQSLMVCVMKYTQNLMETTRGNITRREEEEALDAFTFRIGVCDNSLKVETVNVTFEFEE